WLAAERCFAAAERWEDAAWAAERRRDWGRALALMAHARAKGPEEWLRLALREAHLIADGLRDETRAAARYDALPAERPRELDASSFALVLGASAERGALGAFEDVAARVEAAAMRAPEHRAVKIAFELAASPLSGAARAAELVRQAEALVGLGADRRLAVRR